MKRNKLYTVNAWNKNLFDDGGTPVSTVNPPASTSAPTNGTSTTGANGASGTNGNSSGGSSFVDQMGGWGNVMQMGQQADGMMTQLGGLIAGGRTSTAGDILTSMGNMGIPGMGFLGGVVNAAFGTKWNKENIAKFEGQNNAYNKATFGAGSDAEVLSNFASAEDLADVAKSDVGKDGWFSRKAKRKTAAINKARSDANAHKQAALVQNALDLDTNKDNSLLQNFAAQGGPINRFDGGGDYASFGDWWNKQGKSQYFGVWGNPSQANQARIQRQQGYKTGASGSQFGGASNAMAYMSAAQSIIGDATHWKDEDYIKSTMGSNAGMGAGALFNAANIIFKNAKGDEKSLEDKIGLAEGGPVNKFAMGGGDYAQIASSVMKLANNAAMQADTKDIDDIESQLRRRSNVQFTGSSNNDLMSSWNDNYRAYNSENITDYDLRGKTWGEDIVNGLQAGTEGATTGFQVGGPWGAVIGGIIGTGSSIVGTAIGRSKAKEKRKKLVGDIATTNQRQVDTFEVMKDNTDRQNDINAKALDFAFGGPYATQQPIVMMMPNSSYTPSSGAINYQLSSDVLGISRAKANLGTTTTTPNNMTTGMKELKTFADGGGIHIKPENRGKFTEYKKRTGKTTEEALHSPDPHVRQMANFARNAAKWHHENGGYIAGESYDLSEAEIQRLIDAGYQIRYE